MADDGMSLADWELKLAQVNVAIEKVLKGKSYTMDEVSYSRENLQSLLEFQKECRREIAQKKNEAAGGGSGPRVITGVLAGG